MLALATLPSPVRARYLRTDDKLKPKLDARLHAIATLAQTPRSRWGITAGLLSSALAPRHGRGFSAKNLLNLFRDYREHGPEALMLDYGSGDEKPAEFVNELARRVEGNNRVASVELDAIRADWLTGAAIKGYGTWRDLWREKFGASEELPEQCPEWFIPAGWSQRNLRRLLPGDTALTLARDGFFAAHGKLPQKRNDYSELRALEMVVFDDVRTDWLVNYPGVSKACELWLLVAMDVASRCVLDWVSLAAVPDDEGKRAELLEEHMKLLGGSLLQRYGIPSAYPMTWLVENQKATYREAAQKALATLSGGQIVVQHTRMVNRSLPSGYGERHGTPWHIKGVLERFFGSFHDHTAALPGQTGASYQLAPAELKDRKKEHESLMLEVADLPPAVVDQLRLPFLRYSEGVSAIEQVLSKLNNRTKHNLQGFDRIELWRFPEDHAWRPIDDLRRFPAAEVRRAIFESRMEKPVERFEKLLRQYASPTRVPPEALLPFSARTIAKVRHPAPYTIAFREGGTEWIYRGELPELASGEGGPFCLKLLPGDLSVAYLHDAATGSFLGALRHVPAAPIGNEEAQLRAVGEVQHARALVVGPVMARHAEQRAETEQGRELNAAVIAAARSGRAMVDSAGTTKATQTRLTADARRRNSNRAAQLAAAARANLPVSSEI